ncbi:MAG: hypothetical protein MUF18_19430 [Fimbriiglobus sp.]|nr:hypothetical protein [Fimbriiglobus sp.]
MRHRLFPLLAVLAIGCGTGTTTTTKISAPPITGPVGPVELTPVTAADLDKAIAAHKGKVVLIDCWFLG